jgi:hypothetical protein
MFLEANVDSLPFFNTLFYDLEDYEFIHLRVFDRDTGAIVNEWFPTREAAIAAATYFNTTGRNDVYFGINARQQYNLNKGGVTKIRVLHADMDFKHFPGGRDEAMNVLLGFELHPTVIVDSGGGYHLYWLLGDPLDPSDANVAYAESLMERLYYRLGGLDKVQDVSRIFRVPNTRNHKYEHLPVAEVLELDVDNNYSLAQFEAVLPKLPERRITLPGDGGEYVTATETDVASMLAVLPGEGWDYRDYCGILMAIHSVLPDERGVRLVQGWAPVLDDDGTDITAEKFASFRSSGYTIGTLVHHALDHGWVPPQRGPKLILSRDGAPRFPKSEGKPYVREWETMLGTQPPVTYDELPYMLRVWHDYLYPATKNFPVEWTTMMTLAFWSTQWQRVEFENFHLNLWFLGIGPQSGGKSIGQTEALKDTRLLMQRRELDLALFSSGTTRGLMNGVKGADKQLLACFDEFSGFLKSAQTDYTAGIKEALCSLYDGASFTHRKAEETVETDNPYMCLSGITTPSFFISAAKREDMANGFMSRFFFCVTDALRNTPTVQWDADKRAALVEQMFEQVTRFGHITKAKFDVPFGQEPECYATYLRTIGMNTGELVRLEDELRQPEAMAWGRVAMRVKKVATLLALARETPKIVGDTIYVHDTDVALAVRLCHRSAAYQKRAMEWLATSSDEANVEKVLYQLTSHKDGQTGRQLMANCHLKKTAVTDALSVLLSDGVLYEESAGRATVYKVRESRV